MARKANVIDTQGIRVFVYGTLKRGHPNHTSFLKEAEFLGRYTMQSSYTMVDLGPFPGVVLRKDQCGGSENLGFVCGEVYRIDRNTLDALDSLEGHPHFYKRKKITTPWKNAWMYTLPDSYIVEERIIPSGLWRPTEEELTMYCVDVEEKDHDKQNV